MLVDEPVFEPEVKRRSVSSYHALNEARQFRISQAFVNDMAGGDCKNTGAGIYEGDRAILEVINIVAVSDHPEEGGRERASEVQIHRRNIGVGPTIWRSQLERLGYKDMIHVTISLTRANRLAAERRPSPPHTAPSTASSARASNASSTRRLTGCASSCAGLTRASRMGAEAATHNRRRLGARIKSARSRPGTGVTQNERDAGVVPHAMYCPPLAVRVEPVMKPDSSAARNTTQRAISSGWPSRRTGICGRIAFSSTSFGTAITISVAM